MEDDLNRNVTPLSRKVKQYMNETKINIQHIKNKKEKEIIEIIRKKDTQEYINEIEERPTLKLYRFFKREIKDEEKLFDNTFSSKILMEARSDSLELGWRKRFQGHDTLCGVCKLEEETNYHFLCKCPKLEQKRRQINYDNDDDLLKKLLCFNKLDEQDIDKNKRILNEMWNERKKIIKFNEKQ